MSFLFKSNSNSSNNNGRDVNSNVPTPTQSPPLPNVMSAPQAVPMVRPSSGHHHLPPHHLQQHGEDRSGADSPSARMPTFHSSISNSSSFSSVNNLLGGSSLASSGSSYNNAVGGVGGSGQRKSGSSAPGTPPNELAAVTRQSSVSSVGLSSSSSSSTAPMQMPHASLLMGKHVSASGSLHNIYHSNVIMTPSSSLPSTPNTSARYMEAIPNFAAAAAAPGMPGELSFANIAHHHQQQSQMAPLPSYALHAPLAQAATSASSTSAVRASPTGSPSSSPPPHALQQQQLSVALKMPPTPSAPASAAMAISPVNEEQTHQQSTAAATPNDEVSQIRAMFASRALSRSIFTLGDTLGTGTFGRVRIVTYTHPSPAASSTAVAVSAVPVPAGAVSSSGKPMYFALKMLKKSEIIRLKQVEHIKAEKAILSRIAHPFIVNLYSAFQDERNLYMTMEYVIGGELFSQLRKVGRFSNDTARFYAGEIVLALSYLHDRHIVYRDLKPENLLIDKEGHIKVRSQTHSVRDDDSDGKTWGFSRPAAR
jgi:hypothetical protein